MRFGQAVVLFQGRLFGYNLRYLPRPVEREALMESIKNNIPMKMFDRGSKRWWVPEIYSHIMEQAAIERGALLEVDLQVIREYRNRTPEIAVDFTTLGVLPESPLRLCEMAWMYWQSVLHQDSLMLPAFNAKREAWERIKAHFEKPPVVAQAE